jgi:hypothetical protein
VVWFVTLPNLEFLEKKDGLFASCSFVFSVAVVFSPYFTPSVDKLVRLNFPMFHFLTINKGGCFCLLV